MAYNTISTTSITLNFNKKVAVSQPELYPNSWINKNGTINFTGIVYCSQPIPCGE